jgi:hypothetical protein
MVLIFGPVLLKMALRDEVIGLIKRHSQLVGRQNIMMCGATPADHREVFCGTSTAADAIATI